MSTKKETSIAAEVLSRAESPLPTFLFTEIARLVNTPLIELLPFKIKGSQLLVRMIPRPKDDIIWKGQIHVPGSAFRPGEDIKPVLTRLFQEELEETTIASDINYAGMYFYNGERGTEQAHVCYFLERENSMRKIGKLYRVNNLPEEVVAAQLPMIYSVADQIISKYALSPLDPSLPKAEIMPFEQHLARLLANIG